MPPVLARVASAVAHGPQTPPGQPSLSVSWPSPREEQPGAREGDAPSALQYPQEVPCRAQLPQWLTGALNGQHASFSWKLDHHTRWRTGASALLIPAVRTGGDSSTEAGVECRFLLKLFMFEAAAKDAQLERMARSLFLRCSFDSANVVEMYSMHDASFAPDPRRHCAWFALERLDDRESEPRRGSVTGACEVPSLRSESTTLKVGLAVCRGLSAMHRRGLVHGAVEPANLVVTQDPAKTVLAGLGRMQTAKEMEFVYKPGDNFNFRAPEQWDEEGEVCARTDVWQLGQTLLKMLSGSPVDPPSAADPALAAERRRQEFAAMVFAVEGERVPRLVDKAREAGSKLDKPNVRLSAVLAKVTQTLSCLPCSPRCGGAGGKATRVREAHAPIACALARPLTRPPTRPPTCSPTHCNPAGAVGTAGHL